jgi:hypothetical protein
MPESNFRDRWKETKSFGDLSLYFHTSLAAAMIRSEKLGIFL